MDNDQCSLWRAFAKSPVSVILIVYTFIAAWFVGGLTTFHIYLICTNQVLISSFTLFMFVNIIDALSLSKKLTIVRADNIRELSVSIRGKNESL